MLGPASGLLDPRLDIDPLPFFDIEQASDLSRVHICQLFEGAKAHITQFTLINRANSLDLGQIIRVRLLVALELTTERFDLGIFS